MKTKKKIITGLHIFGEFLVEDKKKLTSLSINKKFILGLIKKYELNLLGVIAHKFPKSGFTLIFLHSWPEFSYLTLDIYLCNFKKDNTETVKKIFNDFVKFYQPSHFTKKILRR